MRILEAIRKGFSVAGSLKNLVVMIFLVNVVFNVATTLLAPPNAPPGQLSPAASFAVAILAIVFILLGIFIQGGTFSVVRDNIKSGIASLADFIASGKKFYLRLLGIGIVVLVVLLLVALLTVLIIGLGVASKNNVIGIILGAIVGIIGVVFMFFLSLSPYAVVCDDSGIIIALKKSIDIVRGNFFKILGIFILIILIAFGLGLVIGIVMGFLGLVIKNFIVRQLISAVVMSALNAYITVFATGGMMAFYLSSSQSQIFQKPLTQAP